MVKTKAQLHTLEGMMASILILLAMAYGLNSFVAVPTGDQHDISMQDERQLASDILTQAETTGELQKALLNWSNDGFNESGSYYYYLNRDPPGGFGEDLEEILRDNQINYNIDLVFNTEDGDKAKLSYIRNGEPGANALRTSINTVLYDEHRLGTDVELRDASNHTYPVKNVDRNLPIYNIVKVEVTIW